MKPTRSRRRMLSLFAPLAAVALFVASPAPRQAVALGCGENTGPVCRQNESCAWFVFFKQCTTTYDYYPAASTT